MNESRKRKRTKKKSTCYFLLLIFIAKFPFCASLTAHEMITNPYRNDGFGAQFQTIIYAIIYAELNNKEFKYTPFQLMDHNYGNDTDFIKKKEELINVRDFFPINDDPTIQGIISPRKYIDFFEHHLFECARSRALKYIRQIFRSNKNRSHYFNDENLNIAIHIRRPNPHDVRIEGTDTPDDIYVKMIETFRSTYRSNAPLFHIYSQGNLEEFQTKFAGKDIIFHINESIEDTFTSMVLADILMTSRSSFSYTAALLSEGLIYYMPFWHPPLSTWINIAWL
jgi:hypothetical protein